MRVKSLVLFALVIALAVGGCGEGKDTQRKDVSGQGAGGIKLGGELRDAMTTAIVSLDPVRIYDFASRQVGIQIYDGLVEFNQNLQIVPALATSWESSQDNRVWTFRLRKGVRFHDDAAFPENKGREITAQDVKYSFERVVNPKTQTLGSWIFTDKVVGAQAFFDGKAKEVKGFVVVDPYTIRVELTRSYAPFLNLMALPFCWIVPREAVEKYGEDFTRHPVGSGAFRFVKWEPDQRIELVRNDHYWQKDSSGNTLPYLERLTFRFLRDTMVQFIEFKQGNLEVSEIPGAVHPQVVTPAGSLTPEFQRYQLKMVPSTDVYFYGFNLKDPLLGRNLPLRQALNYAINREEIIRVILKGRGIPSKGILPPGLPGYSDSWRGYTYDPDKAKSLLKEAGYPDGQGLPELTVYLDAGTEIQDLAVAVQSEWAKLGVKVKLQVVQWPQLLDLVAKAKTRIFRNFWLADYPDAENFFLALLARQGKNFVPVGPNQANYRNDRFDALYDRALTATSEADRAKLYQEAEQIAVHDAPWVFLYHGQVVQLQQPHVRNYRPNGLQFQLYKYAWIDR